MSETPSGMLLFLKCHGPLVQEFHDKGVRLTLAGKLFAVSFLVSQGYISDNSFVEVRDKVKDLAEMGIETDRMIAVAAYRWLKASEKWNNEVPFPPTDLSTASIRALLSILIASQERREASLKAN